ncbi:MAG: PAS domain-containing protein [Candidatus Eremiobacteraeota bacterium]|nr:PAS domain-containing protein [Candidatus Eremiobacteraeota bacterium]
MLEAGYAADEPERLRALEAYRLLENVPDAALDEITHLTRMICEVPIAWVCLVDHDLQWVLASEGLERRSVPRPQGYCAHVILQKDLVVVEDLQRDERFRDNPAFPGYRFYAAMPLMTEEGLGLGTLAVLDYLPRKLTDVQCLTLRTLAHQVMSRFELLRQSRQRATHYERLHMVCQATNDAIWDYNPETRCLWWSEGYQTLFGHSRLSDCMPLSSWTDYVHPEDLAEVQRDLRLTLNSAEQTWSSHYRFRRLDGSYAEIFDRGTVLRDASGVPIRMVGAMQDVTRSVYAEARYRQLFEHFPDGIAVLNKESIYIDANQRLCEMFGYSKEQFIGLHPREIIRPDQEPGLYPVIDDIHAGGAHSQEWIMKRSDGSLFPADINAKMMVDGTMLASIRDVSERHRVQAALRVAEERMRFALDNARVGVWDMDITSGRTDWSDWLQIQFGYKPGTFPGTSDAFLSRVHPEDLGMVERRFEQGDDFGLVIRSLWPDGTTRWIRAVGHVYRDAQGRPKRSLGISQDITEQRSLEEQVQQSQKLEAVGRLAGGVAHDFNNLLTIILGFVEMLRADLDEEDERMGHLNDIEQAADSATSLVRQLLAFSRKQVIETRQLNLNEVLSGMRAMLPRLIPEDVIIEFRLSEGEDLWVKADRGQLEQVILNLAVNARDAMPLGGRLILEVAGEDEWVLLRVCDTGSGIPPQILDRLFEPFFTTKEVGRGTGLGLATVHGIVTQAGGKVQVWNRAEGGACFEARFPRCEYPKSSHNEPGPE